MKFKCRLKGVEKIRCELKSGEEKDYNVTPEVYKFAESFQKGDFIACGEGNTTFKEGKIIKLVKYEPKQKSGNKSNYNSREPYKKNYSGGSNYKNKDTSIIRQVIFKAAVELVAVGNTEFGNNLVDVYKNMKHMFDEELMATGNMKFEGKPKVEKKEVTEPAPTPTESVEEEPIVDDEPEEAVEEEEYN